MVPELLIFPVWNASSRFRWILYHMWQLENLTPAQALNIKISFVSCVLRSFPISQSRSTILYSIFNLVISLPARSPSRSEKTRQTCESFLSTTMMWGDEALSRRRLQLCGVGLRSHRLCFYSALHLCNSNLPSLARWRNACLLIWTSEACGL